MSWQCQGRYFAKVPLVRNWLQASRICAYDNGRLTKVTMRDGIYSRLGHIDWQVMLAARRAKAGAVGTLGWF